MRLLIFQFALFSLCVLPLSFGFEDQDLKCSNREHMTSFARKVESGKKNFNGKCSSFSPSITEDVACSLGIAFKCTGEWEGCDDPSQWIGGFQIFDIDSNAEIYVPYCCTSNQVKIDQSKCTEIKLADQLKQNFNYLSTNNRLFSNIRCTYSKTKDQKTVNYMTMALQECVYNTSSTPQTRSNVQSSTTSTTAGPTTSTKAIDLGSCFDRYVSRNQPLDYVEDNIQIIDSSVVENQKDCATRCLHAETEFGTRCRSYKLIGQPNTGSVQTCQLRTNYLNGDKVKFVTNPLYVVYGNRTNVCDTVKR